MGERKLADDIAEGDLSRRIGTLAPHVALDAGKLRDGLGPAIPTDCRGEVAGQYPSCGHAALRGRN